MSEASDSRSFRDLLSQVQRWHEGEAELRKIKKLLKEDPRNTLEAIFEVAEDYKLGWQMHLLNRFGVDAEAMIVLKGFRPPRTLGAAKELLLAGSLHTFWSRVLDARKDALAAVATHTHPYASPKDPCAAAQSAVIAAFEELPATFGVIVQAAQDDRIKEWAATRLATWTDTQINLEINKLLKAALTETRLSPEQAKLLELLPASLIAFAQWRQNEPFRPGSGGKSYVSRAADTLKKSGSEQAEKNKAGEPPRLQYIDPERPEDRDDDLDSLIVELEQQTHFTERQRQVYELDKAGCQEAEIAARLGIAGDTVRVHRKGAMDAMRQAARELGLLDAE